MELVYLLWKIHRASVGGGSRRETRRKRTRNHVDRPGVEDAPGMPTHEKSARVKSSKRRNERMQGI